MDQIVGQESDNNGRLMNITMKIDMKIEDLENARNILDHYIAKIKGNINKEPKIDDIDKFIRETYVLKDGNIIKADDLRKYCIKFFGLDDDFSRQKFGRLMTEYISDRSRNIYGIERVTTKTGSNYKNIELKENPIEPKIKLLIVKNNITVPKVVGTIMPRIGNNN